MYPSDCDSSDNTKINRLITATCFILSELFFPFNKMGGEEDFGPWFPHIQANGPIPRPASFECASVPQDNIKLSKAVAKPQEKSVNIKETSSQNRRAVVHVNDDDALNQTPATKTEYIFYHYETKRIPGASDLHADDASICQRKLSPAKLCGEATKQPRFVNSIFLERMSKYKFLCICP